MTDKRLNTAELDSLLFLLTDHDRVTQRVLADRFCSMTWDEMSYCLANVDRVVPAQDRAFVRMCLEDASSVLAFADLQAGLVEPYGTYVPDCLYWLTRIVEPYLSPAGFRNLYERMGNDLICELRDNMTALEKAEILNHMFFSCFGFCMKYDGDNGRDVVLTNILKNREGGEIGLSSAYFLFARYADLPVYPVFPDNPGYYVGWIENGEALFTMDICNKGKVSDPVPSHMWKNPRMTGLDCTIYYVYAASLRYMGLPLSDKKALLLDRALNQLRV